MPNEIPPQQSNTAQSIQGWRIPLSLLSNREFFFIWAAGAIQIAVTWFEGLATAVFIFEQTKSPFYVAFIFVARLTPLALFGSLAGVLAGRFNRRTMLICGYGLLATVFTILAVLALLDQIMIWHIYVGAFINGIVMSFDWPVRYTMMGELAGSQRIGSAMSLDMATRMGMYLLGPMMGGLVFQFIGLQGIYLFACLLFFLAVSLILATSFRFASNKTQRIALLPELLQGFRYARSNRVMLAVLAITLVMNIFGVHALQAMVPVIGIALYQLSPFEIGTLMAAAGSGGLLGAVGISMFAQATYYRRLFFGGTFLFFLTTFLFALSSIFWLLFPLLFLGGIGLAFFGGMQPTILLLEAVPEMRSRVMGLLVVCIGAAPIGMLSIGTLAEWIGASQALALGSFGGIFLLIFSFFCWPELRKQ